MGDTSPLILPAATSASPHPGKGPRRRKFPTLAVDAAGLARMLSCGTRTIRTWDAGGKIPAPVRVSGRVLWVVSDIRDWLAAGAPDRERWQAIKSARRK